MRITGFPVITIGSLTTNDVLLIESLGLGTTNKVTLTTLANYIMSGTFGTSAFATLSTSQTVSNKRFNTCTFNSATATSITSEDLNKIAGMSTTKAELELLHNLTSIVDLNSVQSLSNKTIISGKLQAPEINNGTSWVPITVKAEEINFLSGLNENLFAWMGIIEDDIQDLISATEFTTRELSTGWTQSGTDTKVITAANVLSLLGISSGYVVNAFPCIKVYEQPYANVYSECAATTQLTTIYTGGRTNFSEVEIDNLTDGKSYVLSMRVELVKIP